MYAALLVCGGQASAASPSTADAAACDGIPGVTDSGPFSWPTLVFFDSDSAALTQTARQRLDKFKRNATMCHVQQVKIEAHVDGAEHGGPGHGLDRRRANAVRAYLVNPALPARSILIRLSGDRDPLIASGDGVAEPQNRFVMVRPMDGANPGDARLLQSR